MSMKRLICLLVTTLLLVALPLSLVCAASFTDFPTGWSATAMTAAVENGLLTGYEDGTIRPETNLTRAQVATIITRAFGAQTTADISAFSDVPSDAWFAPYISKAVKMGALNGTSATTMDPDLPITREQVFTAVGRILVLSNENASVLNKFNDADMISSWAVPYMSALVERGYINGDNLGNVNPKANITREEFAQFMYNAIRTYITEPGTYNAPLEGITVIRVPGVTIQGVNATSDLVLGDGVGTGSIILSKVAIEKRLLARGGTIKLIGTTTGDGVVVNNVNGNTHFNNYRTEAVFAGIVENTTATFLTPGGGGVTTKHTLKFFLKSGDTTPYRTISNITNNTSLGSNLPTIAADDIVGYEFEGWYHGTTQITASTNISGSWNIVAKLKRLDYPVVFKNEDGTAFSYFDGYTPEPTANVETTYAMPLTSNIKRLGYTFNGWKDALGNPVSAINITETTPDSGFELFADFTKNTYYVEFYYEDQVTPVTFIHGFTAPHAYDVDNIPVLPSADKVVLPVGKYFVQWEDAFGNPVAALVVTGDMTNGQILKLYAKTDIVPPTTYDLNFYLHEGDTIPYATISDVVSGTALGMSLPTVNADDIVGYNFRGWFNGTIPVTAYTPIIGDWDIVAKLELIEFPVFFKNEDGTPFSYFDGYTPASTANFETVYAMPVASNIKRVGYTFNGWLDSLGNPVSAITITAATPLTGIELFPDFTKHTYYVEFYNEDGTAANFVSGYVAPDEYSVDSIPALPDDTKVVIPDSTRMFMYWTDAIGNPVYTLTVTEDMQDGDVLKLYTYTELIPLESYTVSFYEGHGTNSYWMKNVTVTEQETVPEADIPDIGPRKVRGYKEDGTVASVYEGNEYTHITVPTYWYELNTYVCADCGYKHESSHAPEVCANCSAGAEKLAVSGKATLVPFDETVQILGDLKVYLLYQRFGLFLNYEDTGLALAITAAYADDTRLMDTYKDLIVSGGNQLNTALMLNQIPKYDELTGKLKDRLVAAGLMDENKNLKLMYLPIGISTLVKEDTANNMVKQYIRDVVNDPARLDSLLQMVDLSTLINQMDTTELINTLSDQDIADIISDTSNQQEVVDFIVTDLQSTNPKMLSMIVNFIQTNNTFREEMISDLMAALMDKDDTSSLKSEALAHLRTLLNTDGSDLQTKFLNTVMDSLSGTNPDTELQNTVIDEIKANGSLKGKFADMLINALKSDDDTDPLKQFAVDQIKTNPTVRGLIIDTLVGDLKNGSASDAVINHIRGSLELNDIIVTALKEKQPAMMQAMTDYFQNHLTSNASLLNTLTTTVQTTISADTEDGKKLREAILMSGELESLLKDSEMKSKIVDMLLTVSFVDKVLSDSSFRGDLLEAAIADEKFVDFLVNTTEFEGFVLPHLRVGGSLEPMITAMLHNAGTFVHEVLADLKGDDTFLGLVKEGGALRSEVLDEILVGDYIVSEDDLLKYIFHQGGVVGDYSFINSADIETIFRDEYEKRPEAATKDFASLTADERQNLLNELYLDPIVRAEAISKINSHFDEYKEDILDEMVAKNNLSDPKVENLINDLLIDYIERYVAEDTTLNNAAKNAVEDILVAYVRELMTRGTIGDADLSDFKDDIIDLKTSFVEDAENLSTITTIIEDFIVEEPTETRIVVNSVYDDLAHDLVTLVQTNASVYADVENKLKTVTVTANILQNFLVNNGGSTTVVDLMVDYFSDMATDAETLPAKRAELDGYIAQCLATMSNASLRGHLVTFLTTPSNETLVRNRLSNYVSGMSDADLRDQLKILAKDPIDSVTLKNNLVTTIGTLPNSDILAHLDTFISTNEADVRSLALDEVKVMTDTKIAGYLATFLGKNADNYTMVETEVRKFLNDPAQEQSVVDVATKYLTNPVNESDIRDYLVDFLTSVDAAFVADNRSTIIEALDAIDLSVIVDADLVKKYIGRLDADGKIAFSNKVFNALKGSDDYKAFMYSLMNEETFEINSSNAGMIQAVSGAIRDLDYDFAMSLTENEALQKIIDVMGDAFLRNYFDIMKNSYCDGLDEALNRVKATAVTEEYTTSLTLQINPLELLNKLYEKAQPELIERMRNAGVRYDENIYLQYLVEHNVMSALFNGNGTLATGDYTGYQLKDVMDYYNYLVSLVMVADDAICWYGDPANVTESEMDAVIDALFGKIYSAHEKLNEILETYETSGQLPSKAQDLVDRVKQINGLLTRFDGQIKSAISKYLNSSINDKLEDGNIQDNEKVDRIIDLLIGTEDPTFNIDSLYTLFYNFGEKVQGKLKDVIDSGKLRAAIDKFESTDFGKLFKGNGKFGTIADKLEEIQNSGKVQSKFDSIYDLLVVTAEEGIEPYRVEKDDVAVVDAYEVNVAGVNLKIKRYYQ